LIESLSNKENELLEEKGNLAKDVRL